MSWPVLGTLAAVPALDRPDLLGKPVLAALEADAPADAALVGVAEIDPDLADTAAFCDAYGSPLDGSANCVVVAGRRGEDTRYAACLVLATTRADVNGLVRKRLNARKASFAPMDDAVALTGMEYGGITPIGLPADWPVLVEGVDADAVTAAQLAPSCPAARLTNAGSPKLARCIARAHVVGLPVCIARLVVAWRPPGRHRAASLSFAVGSEGIARLDAFRSRFLRSLRSGLLERWNSFNGVRLCRA